MTATSHSFRPITCAFTLHVVAATLGAQSPRLSVGAGLSIPRESGESSGLHVLGGALLQSPLTNLFVGLDGLYSVTTHYQGEGGNTKIAGGGASVRGLMGRQGARVRPYLLAGLGVYHASATYFSYPFCQPGSYCYSAFSETSLGWGGGFGLTLGAGPAIGFVEARYLSIGQGNRDLFTVTAGFGFGPR